MAVKPGLEELARRDARRGLDRHALDPERPVRRQRRAAVDRLADAVEHPAEQARPDVEAQGLAEEADPGSVEREARPSRRAPRP